MLSWSLVKAHIILQQSNGRGLGMSEFLSFQQQEIRELLRREAGMLASSAKPFQESHCCGTSKTGLEFRQWGSHPGRVIPPDGNCFVWQTWQQVKQWFGYQICPSRYMSKSCSTSHWSKVNIWPHGASRLPYGCDTTCAISDSNPREIWSTCRQSPSLGEPSAFLWGLLYGKIRLKFSSSKCLSEF